MDNSRQRFPMGNRLIESQEGKLCSETCSGQRDFFKSFAIRKKMVDVTGIEPVTPCLQSTKLYSNNSTGNFNY